MDGRATDLMSWALPMQVGRERYDAKTVLLQFQRGRGRMTDGLVPFHVPRIRGLPRDRAAWQELTRSDIELPNAHLH